MKIILTGFTQRHTNSQRLRYDYLTATYLLRDALVKLGHEVDHRAVTPGEELGRYDRAVIGVGPTKSFTTRFVPGSAWVYRMMPGRVLLHADDWSIEKTGYDFRNTLNRWAQWLKFFETCGPVRGQELEGHEARKADVFEMLGDITSSPDRKLLAPMFTWGQHDLLLKNNLPSRLVAWDPTPLILAQVIAVPLIAERRREWIMATLQKNSKVPRGQWPITQVGNKRTGQAYLPEAEIFKLYQENWGVICPPYSKAGSGWWRYRYQLATDAGAVLWLDPKDRSGMGAAYQSSMSDYERMSNSDLALTAAGQHDWFYEHSASLPATLNIIREALG